jgi:predicted RNA methylase
MKLQQQSKGLNRNIIDKYYTKETAVNLCLEFIKNNMQINKDDLIIEPSAGNGSFINGIKSLSDNYKFYDLEPENDEIEKQDYLSYNYDNNECIFKPFCISNTERLTSLSLKKADEVGVSIGKRCNKIHVIGNPPFGRQSSLAIKFIKKSCEFCDSFSFILPKSFKKNSLKKKIPLNFHLIFEIELPDNSFLVDGVECNVPCIFQIWEKKIENRDTVKKIEPLNFCFVKKTENPDISFRRVGVNAGFIDKAIDKKSIQSHYFIKFTDSNLINEKIKKLSAIKYDFNNTVGPKSISKQELIFNFNPLLTEE